MTLNISVIVNLYVYDLSRTLLRNEKKEFFIIMFELKHRLFLSSAAFFIQMLYDNIIFSNGAWFHLHIYLKLGLL